MPKKADSTATSRLDGYQRTIAAFSRIVGEAVPLDQLWQQVCAQAAGATGIRRTKLLRYRPEQGDLLVVAGVGWKDGVVGTATLPTDTASPPGRSLQTAAPVLVLDITSDTEFRISGMLRDHGIVSLLNVPVTTDGGNWGVLEVDSTEKRSFDEADVTFVLTLANLVGVAISRHAMEQRHAEALAETQRLRGYFGTMVQELQHRAKNNLQTIMSSISIQRRRVAGEEARGALTAIIDRVHAIALAHEQLAVTGDGSLVDVAAYLRSLCSKIVPRGDAVRLACLAEPALLPLDRAVPVGLIVNELITNSLKYAFDEGAPGRITVTFALHPEIGEASVTVADDGKGMGPARAGGLGTSLNAALCQQISGRMVRDDVGVGTSVRVVFPMALPA